MAKVQAAIKRKILIVPASFLNDYQSPIVA